MRADIVQARRTHDVGRLLRYAAPHTRGWMAVVSASLAATALSLAQPWPLKLLVDHVLGDEPMPPGMTAVIAWLPGSDASGGLIVWIAVAGVGVFLAGSAIEAALSIQWTKVGRRMVNDLARDVFAKAQRRSLPDHARHSIGDSMSRVVGDSWCVHTLVDTLLFAPGHALLTTVLLVVVMVQLDVGLTLMALAVAPLMAVAARVFGQPIRRASQARREAESRIHSHVQQTLSGIPVVQAFTREDEEEERFQKLASDAIRAQQRTALVSSVYGLGSGLLATAGTAGVMWMAALRVLDGRLTTGTALVFLSYLATLQWQLNAFARMYTALQGAGASVDRVIAVLDEPEGVPERPDAAPLPAVRGEVRIERVTFGYLPGQPVLRDVSIVARPGDTVAIVGATGAGKSTLAGLIPRFFDPDEGRVLVDGHDVRHVQLGSLRDQVSIVLQEPFLFAGSIADNIRLGRPDASREALEAAAQAANAHGFITSLPQGYDTVVGERGGTLSGGERQRIAIARAMLKNAPILILDEPTSALDAETEYAVVEALERLMRGRTTFIIAHRLSTIRNATSIVVLDRGRVVEHGTHVQLLHRGGVYSELYALHCGGELVQEAV